MEGSTGASSSGSAGFEVDMRSGLVSVPVDATAEQVLQHLKVASYRRALTSLQVQIKKCIPNFYFGFPSALGPKVSATRRCDEVQPEANGGMAVHARRSTGLRISVNTTVLLHAQQKGAQQRHLSRLRCIRKLSPTGAIQMQRTASRALAQKLEELRHQMTQ